MDATPYVEPGRPRPDRLQSKASAHEQSVEAAREQIYATLNDLRARVEQLQGYVHSRFGSINDPLHVRERIREQPIGSCGFAFVTGFACGVLRLHWLPLLAVRNAVAASSSVVRGAGVALGSRIAAQLASRAFGSAWQFPMPK